MGPECSLNEHNDWSSYNALPSKGIDLHYLFSYNMSHNSRLQLSTHGVKTTVPTLIQFSTRRLHLQGIKLQTFQYISMDHEKMLSPMHRFH